MFRLFSPDSKNKFQNSRAHGDVVSLHALYSKFNVTIKISKIYPECFGYKITL